MPSPPQGETGNRRGNAMASLAEAIRIISLGGESAELVNALHRQIFPPDTGERWRREDMSAMLKLPGTLCLLARRGEAPVGYALARFAAHECELLSLGVLAGARRTGIGNMLLSRVRDSCRRAEAERLILEVRADNAGARRFYSGHGFREVGRRRNYYRGAGGWAMDAITMAYDLAESTR